MARVDMTETDHGGAGSGRPRSRFRTALDALRHDRGIWRRGILLAVTAVHPSVPPCLKTLGDHRFCSRRPMTAVPVRARTSRCRQFRARRQKAPSVTKRAQ